MYTYITMKLPSHNFNVFELLITKEHISYTIYYVFYIFIKLSMLSETKTRNCNVAYGTNNIPFNCYSSQRVIMTNSLQSHKSPDQVYYVTCRRHSSRHELRLVN